MDIKITCTAAEFGELIRNCADTARAGYCGYCLFYDRECEGIEKRDLTIELDAAGELDG